MDDLTLQSQLSEIRTDLKELATGMADLKTTMESGFARILAVQETHAQITSDHEQRLREVEHLLPDYVTRAEAEAQAAARQRRFYLIGGLLVTPVTAVVSAVVTILLTGAGA